MEASLFMSLFVVFLPAMAKRREPKWYSVISVITGSEILVKNSRESVPGVQRRARLAGDDRRVAAYRKSPRSTLLVLND